MTAFKGLSSSGVFRLPVVGATIEVSRIVMALIMRPRWNAIWDGVGGSGRVWGSRRPCLPLPGCSGSEVSTLSSGDRNIRSRVDQQRPQLCGEGCRYIIEISIQRVQRLYNILLIVWSFAPPTVVVRGRHPNHHHRPTPSLITPFSISFRPCQPSKPSWASVCTAGALCGDSED